LGVSYTRREVTMDFLKAAATILQDAEAPLHYREIADRAIAQGLIKTTGRTPWATMNARLTVDIRARGSASHFQRTAPGMFALRIWGLPEQTSRHTARRTVEVPAPAPAESLGFADAAERVLDRLAGHKPMHYTRIVELAQDNGWLRTEGKTPEATLAAVISQENARRRARGEEARFIARGRGLYGLARWEGTGLTFEIEQKNKRVRQELHGRLLTIHPKEFESLIGRLLVALGFDKVEITVYHKDGGIDVRGELVVGDVIRTKMAVQVKRWKNNVQTPIVQQLRGSLGAHEQGLIITTSDFSDGARQEASRPDAAPVALMNGQELVGLLVEHSIGVRKEAKELLELALAGGHGEASSTHAG